MLKRLLAKINRLRSPLTLPYQSYAVPLENSPITILDPKDKPGGLTLEELAIVTGICKTIPGANIFEFGFYRGRTTTNIAYNCPNCSITAMDLPLDGISGEKLSYSLTSLDKVCANHDGRGYFFNKYPELIENISCIFGDSATFDFKPYYGQFDIIFIDAAHRYENVLSDSENAFKMLKKDRGIILWHDYAFETPGVVRAIHEIQIKYSVPIYHIKRTKLAYLLIE